LSSRAPREIARVFPGGKLRALAAMEREKGERGSLASSGVSVTLQNL
jgi:hypothetical protein